MCIALLAARSGAAVLVVSHQGRGAAQLVADRLARAHGIALEGADGSSPAAIMDWLPSVHILFSAARAGVQVLDRATLAAGTALAVVADANAVPPSGIEGIGANDKGCELTLAGGRTVRALGALAIGDVKYKVHTALLERLYGTATPVFLAHEEAYACARTIVAR